MFDCLFVFQRKQTSLKKFLCGTILYKTGEGNGTPLQALLPGKSHGQRSLVCFSPWGREESDTTERIHFHFSLSCIGEGNGNLLQCSCLENPRDGGAWWAAVYEVAQSRTQLKRLSSSSILYKTEISVKPYSQRSGQRSCTCDFSVPQPCSDPCGTFPFYGT